MVVLVPSDVKSSRLSDSISKDARLRLKCGLKPHFTYLVGFAVKLSKHLAEQK